MANSMYDLTDPTTRATVQEIRKQAIQDAIYVVSKYLIEEESLMTFAPLIARLNAIADNPSKP